jgi:hypothetical protein
MERSPISERITNLVLRGVGSGSIGFLLLALYSVIRTNNRAAALTLVFLPLFALIGAFVGGGMGLLIYICVYALRRNTGIIERSLLGVSYIMVIEWSLGMFTPKTSVLSAGPMVDWLLSLILLGILPAMYAGAFASPAKSLINESAIVISPDSHSN